MPDHTRIGRSSSFSDFGALRLGGAVRATAAGEGGGGGGDGGGACGGEGSPFGPAAGGSEEQFLSMNPRAMAAAAMIRSGRADEDWSPLKSKASAASPGAAETDRFGLPPVYDPRQVQSEMACLLLKMACLLLKIACSLLQIAC